MKQLGFICLLLTGQAFARVGGAVVQAVDLNNNIATITVLNQSDQDITGFSLAIKATLADGHIEPSVFTEDYGPLTGKVLRAHGFATETETYNAKLASVEANVTVVLYRDGTAEAEDQATLDNTIAVRAGIAKALRRSADTLNAALSDANPTKYARGRLQKMLAAKEKDVDQSFIQNSLKLVNAAPADHEREFLQEQAARYAKEAAAFEAYANVTRLP